MKINSVALIGAGAIGAYFISGLQEKLGRNFRVVAEGERAERLRRDGLVINGNRYELNVVSPKEAHGADLLLVATKYAGLPGALPEIRAVCDDHTIVMSLLNGIDSEEIIGTVVDPSQIVYSLMRIASHRVGDSVNFDPERTDGLYLGEKGSPKESERIRAIEELCEEGGLRYHFVEDIIADQWAKYTLNISYNLPQAVLGVGYASYFDSEHVMFISKKLEEEVRTVADAYGIRFRPLENTRERYLPSVQFSTLQDLNARRHTEIDMFCGVLMKKAAEKGVPVPYAEYTWHLIKALEEKNDGLFDYT